MLKTPQSMSFLKVKPIVSEKTITNVASRGKDGSNVPVVLAKTTCPKLGARALQGVATNLERKESVRRAFSRWAGI